MIAWLRRFFPAPRAKWVRLKREYYARGSYYDASCDVEVTVGISYDPPDDVAKLTLRARELAQSAVIFFGGNHQAACNFVQKALEREYPNRPFFVETDEEGAGVQVYQPYGMPQDGSTP